MCPLGSSSALVCVWCSRCEPSLSSSDGKVKLSSTMPCGKANGSSWFCSTVSFAATITSSSIDISMLRSALAWVSYWSFVFSLSLINATSMDWYDTFQSSTKSNDLQSGWIWGGRATARFFRRTSMQFSSDRCKFCVLLTSRSPTSTSYGCCSYE